MRSLALCASLLLVTASAGADLPPLEQEVIIDAPRQAVWDAFTDETARQVLAPRNRVDLRVGGQIRTSYDPASTLDDPQTIVLDILALDPPRMIAWRAHPPANPPFPAAGVEGAWNVIYLEALGEKRTRLRSIGLGWPQTPEGEQARAFFERGNPMAFERLRSALARDAIDAGARDAALAKLQTLVGGDWIVDERRADGGVFRARVRYERLPDGRGLAARAWLGDADAMFYHGATLIYFEPGSDAPRFLNVDQNGAVAAGDIRVVDADTMIWEWNAQSPDGKHAAYRCRTRFVDDGGYRFELFAPDDAAMARPAVDVTYRRVEALPEGFAATAP